MKVKAMTQYALSDISLVVFRTASEAYPFTTASEAEMEQITQEGEEQSLIIKSKVVANRPAIDTVLGHDITLLDNVFCMETLQLMQGGKIEGNKYTAPAIGEIPAKTKFEADIYSASVSTDGDTGDFMKFTFTGCTGNSVPLEIKDGEYIAPEYTINSRPPQGEALYIAEKVSSLPSFELNSVLISGNSEAKGTAGDKKITSLTTGKIYRLIDLTENKTYYSLADGTLTKSVSSKAALTGTEITGLENGHTYLVDIIE